MKIPNYHALINWTARNAIQLLDDIIEARNNNKEVYRVGTLILHREQETKDNEVFNMLMDNKFNNLLSIALCPI